MLNKDKMYNKDEIANNTKSANNATEINEDEEKDNETVTIVYETKLGLDGAREKVKTMNYNDQREYGQTPYYQQRVGGQPVYIQDPVNAQRTPAYRPRDEQNYQPPPGYYRPQSQNGMHNEIFRSTFDERRIRNKFVQRVYTILSIQILFTGGFISLSMFIDPMREFFSKDLIGFIIAMIISLVVYLVLVCVTTVRRTVPYNFIMLAVFTMAETYVFTVLSAHYSTFIVFSSMGITAIVCISLSFLACFVCCDVTGWGMYLCAASVIISIFGIIALCLTLFLNMKIMFLIYAGLIALLFSMYLVYDTQQIIGGRRIQLSEEEYICGALTLYVDVMQIFWAVLALCGFSGNCQ